MPFVEITPGDYVESNLPDDYTFNAVWIQDNFLVSTVKVELVKNRSSTSWTALKKTQKIRKLKGILKLNLIALSFVLCFGKSTWELLQNVLYRHFKTTRALSFEKTLLKLEPSLSDAEIFYSMSTNSNQASFNCFY